MRRYIYRVRIDDPQVKNCITVPKSIIQMHSVEPTPEQHQQHLEYITEYQNALNLATYQNDAKALSLIIPLIQIANQPANGSVSNKLIKLGELVEQSKSKVVIFCHYVTSARIVTRFLESILGEERVTRLYATDPLETPTSLTQEMQVERRSNFQYNPSIKAGVFSINLASQSIDLTSASDVIYYCCGWSAIQMQQSLKRAVRPGNPNAVVNSHYLYTKGLIDTHQVSLAIEKIKGSRLLMDFDLEDVTGSDDLSPAEAVRRLLAS
jgi:ERCC4-related helicase